MLLINFNIFKINYAVYNVSLLEIREQAAFHYLSIGPINPERKAFSYYLCILFVPTSKKTQEEIFCLNAETKGGGGWVGTLIDAMEIDIWANIYINEINFCLCCLLFP